MNTLTIGYIGIFVLILLIFMGAKIGVALGSVGIVGCIIILGVKSATTLVGTTIYGAITSYSLVVIPLFIFMGMLAGSGQLSKRMFDAICIWFGRFRAGLGISTIVGCTGFGAVCGSGVATAATFARMAAPEMRRHGYDKKLAYGICASGGAIGMLIPPSLLAVTYGVLSGLSIGRLLIAGVGAGFLMALIYSITIIIVLKVRPKLGPNQDTLKTTTWKEKIMVLPDLWPVILCGGIIFVGIFSGIFTPTEAASVAAFVMIIVVIFVERKKAWHTIKYSFSETTTMTSMIFLILAGAMVFSKFMVLSGINELVVTKLLEANLSNTQLVIMFMVIYLAMGTIMEGISILSITIPTVGPVIQKLGIDPIWFAILVIAMIQIGLTTPPVGNGAYAAKGVAESDVTIGDIFTGCVPFLIVTIPLFALYILFPQIITFLPNLIK